MQKVYCFVEDKEEPIISFETCCLPRINETMLIKGTKYLIKEVDHRFKEDYGLCKHEVVIILEQFAFQI